MPIIMMAVMIIIALIIASYHYVQKENINYQILEKKIQSWNVTDENVPQGGAEEKKKEAYQNKSTPLNNVTIHFIYVDVGDAIFFDTNGKDMLIDGGCGDCAYSVLNYLAQINASIDIIVA